MALGLGIIFGAFVSEIQELLAILKGRSANFENESCASVILETLSNI
jgi:hypothetical protein